MDVRACQKQLEPPYELLKFTSISYCRTGASRSPFNPEGMICAERGKILNNQANKINLNLSLVLEWHVYSYAVKSVFGSL